MDDVRVHLPANRLAMGHLHLRRAPLPAHHHRVLRAVWMIVWSVHTLQLGPRQARRRSIVWALTLDHVATD
jgi:hypothetical protein